jgi:SAM-dependent methyltransferase
VKINNPIISNISKGKFVNHERTSQQKMEDPQIWHYGLAARSWVGETEGGPEAVFFRQLVQATGQPALDLGCGSGRLLVPYLQAGLDVDGCDYSPDMLAVCKEYLDAEGLETSLYNQPMHELDLPRRYRTIIACGVVGLGGKKDLTHHAMQRCYEHLRPGGVFAFDYETPWNDADYWSGWLPEGRQSLPLDWFPPVRKSLPNGDELENSVRIVSQDPLEGITVRDIRHRLWRGETLIEEDIHTMAMELYTKHELTLMLETAGFREVEILSDYTHKPAAIDSENLVFIARK